MSTTKMIKFLSKANRVIEIPDDGSDQSNELIRIYTLQKLPIITDNVAEAVQKDNPIDRPSFQFYAPYDTLITLLQKKEPSGIEDEEELRMVAETLPGYEGMEETEHLDCFLYWQRKKKWLEGQ